METAFLWIYKTGHVIRFLPKELDPQTEISNL